METTIRAAELDDAMAIAAIYAPYVLRSPATFETVPPDELEMRSRIKRVTAQFPWLVVTVGETLLGYAYASQHRDRHAYQWAIDVSVYVSEQARGQGFGKRLYQALLPIVRRQGYCQAFAGITLPNEASVGLHKSIGFQLVGVYKQIGYKLGDWHDTSWWQLELSSQKSEPAPPISWRNLPNSI